MIEATPDEEERIVARRLAEHEANMRRCLAGIKQLAERDFNQHPNGWETSARERPERN